MAKQKYYAYFFDDKRNGIVESWTECEKIVKGTKARYKSFIDKAVAQNWLDSGANYERKISSTTSIITKLEKGIYFDSGTGRGIGVEVRITDENKVSFLETLPKETVKKILKGTNWTVNEYGNICLGANRTNNFGELTGLFIALKIATKYGKSIICGDSMLVIDYWSKGRFNANNLEMDTIELIKKVSKLREEFERENGKIKKISGDVNPADLGFHR